MTAQLSRMLSNTEDMIHHLVDASKLSAHIRVYSRTPLGDEYWEVKMTFYGEDAPLREMIFKFSGTMTLGELADAAAHIISKATK